MPPQFDVLDKKLPAAHGNITDEHSKKKDRNFREDTQNKIKELYIQWKTPTQIAEALHLLPLEVHNFIQANDKDWADLPMACGQSGCTESTENHKRCIACGTYVHEEHLLNTHKKQWYKMYHVIHGETFCNWCIVDYMKQNKNSHPI